MRLHELRKDPAADDESRAFPDYLLRVGEVRTLSNEGKIVLPRSINIVSTETSDDTAKLLTDSVFKEIETKYKDTEWIASNTILTVKNAQIFRLNEHVGNKIPGSYRRYLSADSVQYENSDEQAKSELCYPQELLNRISAGAAMRDHNHLLKKGFIVMLLHSTYAKDRHASGTLYVVTGMTNNALFLKVAAGQHKGKPLTLPRIKSSPGDENFVIQGLKRLQFPVRVCFAMTITKAQGQSISGRLGLDLRDVCFSPGQLYVALSRATHPKNIYACTQKGIPQTKNVVYLEVFGDMLKDVPKKIAPNYTEEKAKLFTGKRTYLIDDEKAKTQRKKQKQTLLKSESHENKMISMENERASSHDNIVMIADNSSDMLSEIVNFPLSTWSL